MFFNRIDLPEYSAWAEIASFIPSDGVKEHHLMLHINPLTDLFEGQIARLLAAYQQLLSTSFAGCQPVMCRFFLSDIANQAEILKESLKVREFESSKEYPSACSLIGQPPLDGSKVAMWVYLTEGLEVVHDKDLTITRHNGYEHYWSTNWHSVNGGSHSQTRDILEGYEAQLAHYDQNLADHCLRTWFFIRDVDTNYKGMVEARCSNFTMQGLTPDTHYIASTGIGGQPILRDCRVQMDAYAASGLQPEQQQYLYAPTHLNPTYQYGVTFERGTAIHYGDRSHVLISGTASINNKGEVVHVGNVKEQAYRMLENIQTLLQEAQADLSDIAQAIIYLRDITDYPVIKAIFDERLPQMPRVFTLAPVCRPAWLIEMECMAIVGQEKKQFRSF